MRGRGGVQNHQIDFSIDQEVGKSGSSNWGFINPTWLSGHWLILMDNMRMDGLIVNSSLDYSGWIGLLHRDRLSGMGSIPELLHTSFFLCGSDEGIWCPWNPMGSLGLD